MNANDTALLAKSTINLQNRLNLFQAYCIKWKLKVNIDKIKVFIFSNGRLPTNIHFKYGQKGSIISIHNRIFFNIIKPSSCSNSSDKVLKSVTLFFSKNVSKSFKYKENRNADKITHCLPVPTSKTIGIFIIIHNVKCTMQ
jgi:hypothetical protein